MANRPFIPSKFSISKFCFHIHILFEIKFNFIKGPFDLPRSSLKRFILVIKVSSSFLSFLDFSIKGLISSSLGILFIN